MQWLELTDSLQEQSSFSSNSDFRLINEITKE